MLTQKQADALEAAAGDDILSLNVDIQFSFGNPSEGDAMKTHRMLGARFTEDTLDAKQGDKFFDIALPFIARKMQKNV